MKHFKGTVAMTVILMALTPAFPALAESPSGECEVIQVTEVSEMESHEVMECEPLIIAEDLSLSGGFQVTEIPDEIIEVKEAALQEEVQISANAYTEEDLEVLAHAICGEAQGYPDQEQLYVGSVILNRKNHKAYPNTIKEVVFQKGQYACTRDGNYYRTPTEANYRNAKWLLENGSVLPEGVVYQSKAVQGAIHIRTKWHVYCYY